MSDECTGSATKTLFEDVTTVTLVPTQTITVVEGDGDVFTSTFSTGVTSSCPSPTRTGGFLGGGDSDDDDDDDDDDKHSDSGGLLGGLGLSRKRRRRYLSRRQDDSECKVETLYGTTTVTSDGSSSTKTISTEVESTLITSTPTKTLYAPCEETSESTTESESESSTDEETSSDSSSSSSSSSSSETSSSSTTQTDISSSSESDSSSRSRTTTTKTSSTSTDEDSSTSTRVHTYTNSDGSLSSSMETIELPSASSKAKEDSSDDDNSVGTYVGIAVGGVAGILMLLVLARFAYRYFSKEQDDDDVSIENWAAPIDHNRGGDSPNTPPAPHSPEDYYAGAGGMGRSRSDTSSLERDFSSPPMRERNFATYNEPSYQPAAPPPPPPPPPAMWSTAPPLASSAYASAGDESRYSQSSAGRRSSRGAATNISSNSNFAGVGSGFSNSGTPAPPVPPMPPMIKTTPPTNYEGSNRGSQVLVPRRSQLFDNTARAPTDALPSSEPTYSYKEDIEAIGSPRAYGSSHGPLGVANPEDRSRGG